MTTLERDAKGEQQISLKRELRAQVLIWIGIVGGALSIVNQWSNIITLAGWVNMLVTQFSVTMHNFWSFLGLWINVTVPPEVSKLLSLILFYISLTIGTIFMAGGRRRGTTVNRDFFYAASIILMIFFVIFDDAFYNVELYVGKLLGSDALGSILGFIFFLVFGFFIPVYFAPTKALVKRLVFMLIGAGVIFFLSGISRLVAKLQAGG
jgi:hypothetical protein